ncbi:hypothetical protein A1OW_07920 [Enterovibrio norvegicus]|uniref:type II secretion system protein n=1 Tax=Enterovibrio norvegicus TaxID=188144 RepID=UPI000304D3BF|nr:type II secretion system protein [Enterovibrio norvegicus]OEF52729.1 hypothetical protein A1OW_07920 [Enterovibrio norvegicus]
MKRQGGFTLIEMIVVIVILGILAVTAAPKFLSFKDDAQEGALQGLKAAMQSGASITYSSFLIKGETAGTGDDAGKSFVGDVEVVNGFPSATEAGIGNAISISAEDFVKHAGNAVDGEIEYTFASDAGNKCVMYKNSTAENVAPVVTVGNCKA